MRGPIATTALALGLATGAWAEPVIVPVVSLVVRDDPTPPVEPKQRFFKFRSGTRQEPVVHITPPPVGSTDDPTLAGATLTVYNVGGTPQMAVFDLPASRWHVIGTALDFKGYQFHDDSVADGPVFRVFVRPDKVFVVGGRTNWTYFLGSSPQGAIATRLLLGAATEWCAEATARTPASLYDTPAKFVGLKGTRPASCTPVP